jgi:hypothetical protein
MKMSSVICVVFIVLASVSCTKREPVDGAATRSSAGEVGRQSVSIAGQGSAAAEPGLAPKAAENAKAPNTPKAAKVPGTGGGIAPLSVRPSASPAPSTAAEPSPSRDAPAPRPEAPSTAALPVSAPAAPVSAQEATEESLPPSPSPAPSMQTSRRSTVSFEGAKDRALFEAAIVKGNFSSLGEVSNLSASTGDQSSAIEAWAKAVQDAHDLDGAIARLTAEADKEGAPPHVSFALAALYGRKGLVQKQYAALVKAETAAKSRPDVVFALSAVYGRKDTLKAKYGADDLLVGSLIVESEPAGANVFVDGASRGGAPLNLAKIKEGRHRLRVECPGYDAWESPFEIDTGRETKLVAKLGAKPGSVEIIVTPKVSVCLDDGGAEDSPHLFEGVTPGQHLLNFTGLLVDKRYYADEPDIPINVNPGEKVVYKKELHVARSKLQVLATVEGCSYYLDGQKLSDSAVKAATNEGYALDAGVYDLKIISPSGQGWYSNCWLAPVSNGLQIQSTMNVILAPKTIKMDGKRDSWGELEPLIDTPMNGKGVLAGYSISKIYACCDAKYIYWRFDFEGANPLVQRPKKFDQGINIQISIRYDSRKQLNFAVQYRKDMGMTNSYCGIWNEENNKWTDMGNPMSFKSTKDMLIVRVNRLGIGTYIDKPCRVDYSLAHILASGNWENSTTQWRDGRVLDFVSGAKAP